MVINWEINVGNIIQIIAIVVGGLMVLWTLRYDVRALKEGAEALRLKIDSTQDDLENELAEMSADLKKLTDILVTLAQINGKIETLDTRVTATEQEVRDLRRGVGFIRGAGGVDREYP